MIQFDEIPKIYLIKNATDLRKGINGYSTIVQNEFKLDPFEDALFLFCNRTKDKMKILYWDGTGFWLLYKRLDEGKFKWLKSSKDECITITHQQFRWLLEGLNINQRKAFKKKKYKYV